MKCNQRGFLSLAQINVPRPTRVSGLPLTEGHANFAKFINSCAAMLTVGQQHYKKM